MRHPRKIRERCWPSTAPWSVSSPKVLGQGLWAGEAPLHPAFCCGASSSVQGLALDNDVHHLRLLLNSRATKEMEARTHKSAVEAGFQVAALGSNPSRPHTASTLPRETCPPGTENGQHIVVRGRRQGASPGPHGPQPSPILQNSPSTCPCPGHPGLTLQENTWSSSKQHSSRGLQGASTFPRH